MANKKHFAVTENHELSNDEKKGIGESVLERGKEYADRMLEKKEVKSSVVSVEPAPNRVLIERYKEEIAPEGSKIIIPEQVKKLINKGKIVKCGKATPDKPQLYKEGDVVLFPATASMIPYVENDKPYVIVNQFDIYGQIINGAFITVDQPDAAI